jgi:hypothetical protein
MHWLTGSDTKSQLCEIWRTVGALNDSVKVHYSEPFMEYDHNGVSVRLYRDVDATEKHLMELSPVDSKEIKKLCRFIRMVKALTCLLPILEV